MTTKSTFDPIEVGRRLEALRTHHQMQKGDFARSVDIDATSYGKIEKGLKTLNAEMGFRVSERWSVSMDFLYKGSFHDLPPNLAKSLTQILTKADL